MNASELIGDNSFKFFVLKAIKQSLGDSKSASFPAASIAE
jgi:hypothetical protein